MDSKKLKKVGLFISMLVLGSFLQGKRPNVVFVLIDDMGYNALSSYGNHLMETPNIDRLGENGLIFTDAYAMPQCSPTRFAFMTGQYCARTNMNAVIFEKHVLPYAAMLQPESTRVLPPEAVNIGRTLTNAGYRVGHVGKWHVDLKEKKLKEQMGRPNYLKTYGWEGMNTEKLISDDPKNVMGMTHATLNYLDKNRGHPTLAYLAHMTVHTAVSAPEALIQKHVDRGYNKMKSKSGKMEERPIADYLAMIDYLDQSIGVLVDGIEKLDLDRETMIIFMSDNGGLLRVWEMDPLRRGKGSEYEGGVRVPLLVYWPEKIKESRIVKEPVHIVDLFPTFVELAGAKIPEDYLLDGKSLVPIFEGAEKLDREAIYQNLPLYIPHYSKTPSCWMRMGDYKLIRFFGDKVVSYGSKEMLFGERLELYNVREDLPEKKDLSQEMPEKVQEINSMLSAWLKETGAKLPAKNPNFDPEKIHLKLSSKVDFEGKEIIKQ